MTDVRTFTSRDYEFYATNLECLYLKKTNISSTILYYDFLFSLRDINIRWL